MFIFALFVSAKSCKSLAILAKTEILESVFEGVKNGVFMFFRMLKITLYFCVETKKSGYLNKYR